MNENERVQLDATKNAKQPPNHRNLAGRHGTAPVLISQGRMGFLFKEGVAAALASVMQTFLADAPLREIFRQAAWLELNQLWHPRVGAERLVRLSRGLLGLAPMPAYEKGPCCCILKF